MKKIMPKKGKKKLDIVKNIFKVLENEGKTFISRFSKEGYSNDTILDYIEMINWILENGKKIQIEKIGNRTRIISLKDPTEKIQHTDESSSGTKDNK